ncbi:hypothetical protein [Nocardiopsis prasina]|uniref:hypothetical protein n=1 Tax=Nocardiopsis prasina TaxID=2015 RepID=UPI0004767C32|nr:hypothetical protein [Nocardiopsis prasina]
MSWEVLDHAINHVRGEADRIKLRLADLDQHVGHRLLRDADLVGGTRERWEYAAAHLHRLWTVHGAFALVLDRANLVRERGGKDPQRELAFLLRGPSVILPLDRGPLHERGLLDPDSERVTTAEAIARMSADYDKATEVISAVETAWDVLHPRLAELETMWQEVCTLSDQVELGEDEHEGLRRQLVRVGETVRRDPLVLVVEARVDTSSLDHLRGLLVRTRGELRDALRMRDSYSESVARLVSAIDDVEQVLRRARELRERVVAKISAPGTADVPDSVPALRASVIEMDLLRSRSDWRGLGARLGRVQHDVHQASDAAQECERNLSELFARRAELRGRLDAYRARAVRLGLAEHERLAGLHGRAHGELWKAPCDLRAATRALSAYQRALLELSGSDSPEDRTRPGNGASDGETDGGVT